MNFGAAQKFASTPQKTKKTVNQKAEGNKYKFLSDKSIKTDELKPFKFVTKKQFIEIETLEFSAVCPFSGLPDIAKVKISYYPESELCIELKSLKYYFQSFRNVGIYQEKVTNRIYNDLKTVLKTKNLKVETSYNIRGGMDVKCTEGAIHEILL